MDGKNFVPSKSLSAITSYKQWEDIEVTSTKCKMDESEWLKPIPKWLLPTKTFK